MPEACYVCHELDPVHSEACPVGERDRWATRVKLLEARMRIIRAVANGDHDGPIQKLQEMFDAGVHTPGWDAALDELWEMVGKEGG